MTTALHDLRSFGVVASDGFTDWLATNGSLILTRPPNVLLIGVSPAGELTVDAVPFGHATGIATEGATIWLATESHLWRLEDALAGTGDTNTDGCDACFLPQAGAVTGFLDVHDVGVLADHSPLLVSVRFSCLARLADPLSFEPTWLPPWVSAITPEDRCHLTGVAMVDGQPVTAVAAATTDSEPAWKQQQRDGGVAVDVATGEIVGHGLSLPQSPRWHDGRLWLANAGTGELGIVDGATGRFDPVITLPTFVRGLTFAGRYAVVCGSGRRSGDLVAGLPVGDRLDEAGMRPEQGVYVVDAASGTVEHTLLFEGSGREIFGVALVPGVRRAALVSLSSDDVQMLVTYDASWQPRPV